MRGQGRSNSRLNEIKKGDAALPRIKAEQG
jgi:hypothetical protein